MKTTVTREAVAKRTPRKTTSIRTNTAPTRAAQSDWVWPGLTRAQLRDIVIDQIG
jgi:hypothetical protein